MQHQPIIKVRNLIAQYNDIIILDKINLDIYKGEIIGLLGGSGCGKTTLLRHMVGLIIPQHGHIYIDDIEITSEDESLRSLALKKIGILFQGGALFGSMTVAENVALPIMEYTDLDRISVEHLVRMKLKMVGLGSYEHYMPSEISGGMRKRASLARALSLNPEILFLDEPSAGLDPITAAEIDELILYINKNTQTTMVIVTHELDSIFKIADRVFILEKGAKGVIAEGDPLYLKHNSKDPYVRQFFYRQSKEEHLKTDAKS